MELFKSFEDWKIKETKQRIVLSVAENSTEQILKKLIEKKLELNKHTCFLLDINRDFSLSISNLLKEKKVPNQEFFVLQPNSCQDLFGSLEEISNYLHDQQVSKAASEFTFLINNLSGLAFLLGKRKEDFFLQLKLISAQLEIILFSNLDQLEQEELLGDWATKKTSPDQYFSSTKKENKENVVEFNRAEDSLYESFLLKLAQATSKKELLNIRREIQANSEKISENEKSSLSSIYKIHLKRIKQINSTPLEQTKSEILKQKKI